MRFGFLRFSGIVLAGAFALSACGGGSHGSLPPGTPGGSGTAPSAPGAPVGTASATFTFTFPKSTSSAPGKRAPKYVSSATKSVTLQVTDTKNHGNGADIYATVPAALKAVQIVNFANLTGNPNTAGQCGTDPGNAGNYKCTAVYQVPIGDNTMTITSWDANGGTGNKLSQQITTQTAVQGAANVYPISLDANANTMAVNATSGYCAGAFTVSNGQSVPTVGTSPVTFSVGYTDPAGKTIVNPGTPALTVNGGTSGTITGTGGNVTYSVNQSTQTFTLAATTTGTTATINVAAAPANASDGLSFSKTLSFTFQAGAAPPSNNFLALIEQTGAASGTINFFTTSIGSGGGSDSFTPFSTPTLANQGNDVDFPQDLLFDTNGDLMVANGGAGSPDFGNFACVPAGAITTGSNVATVVTTNVDDATTLALGTDNSVAVSNTPASAAYKMIEFVQSGTYTAASATRDVADDGTHTAGSLDVVALPTSGTNPSGSYALAVTDGTNAGAKVVLKHPDGSTINITDPTIIGDDFIAYDPANNQLVIASAGSSAPSAPGTAALSYLDFYSVNPVAQVKSILMDPAGGSPPSSYSSPVAVAVSPTGYVAVAFTSINNGQEVQVYDNTATRAKVSGVIPYDGTTTSGGAIYTYGTTSGSPAAQVKALHWLSGTKLAVSLATPQTASQGLYTYDITTFAPPCGGAACFDAGGTQFPNAPKQTGFLQTNNTPRAVAFKP